MPGSSPYCRSSSGLCDSRWPLGPRHGARGGKLRDFEGSEMSHPWRESRRTVRNTQPHISAGIMTVRNRERMMRWIAYCRTQVLIIVTRERGWRSSVRVMIARLTTRWRRARGHGVRQTRRAACCGTFHLWTTVNDCIAVLIKLVI